MPIGFPLLSPELVHSRKNYISYSLEKNISFDWIRSRDLSIYFIHTILDPAGTTFIVS